MGENFFDFEGVGRYRCPLGALGKRKLSCPCWKSNHDSSAKYLKNLFSFDSFWLWQNGD
jgi:hypothetical protein